MCTNISGLPNDLITDINAGNVLFFVGAGISYNSGAPMVGSIYHELAVALGIESVEFKDLIGNAPFESVMAIWLMDDSIGPHFSKLFSQRVPTQTHYYLARQLSQRNAQVIATTNFDQLIEIAYNEITGRNLQISLPNSAQKIASAEQSLIKLHGCISQDINTLGVTINAVASSLNRENIKRTLGHLIKPRTRFVFMGYSGSDIFDIIPALKELLGDENYIYRVVHAHEGIFYSRPLSEPFEVFNGIELVCNTDELIQAIWRETTGNAPLKTGLEVNKELWKDVFKDWKEDIRKYMGLKEFEILGHVALLLSGNTPKAIQYGRKVLACIDQGKDFNADWPAVIKTQLAQRLRQQYYQEEEKNNALIAEAYTFAYDAVQYYESQDSIKLMLNSMKSNASSIAFSGIAKEYSRALGTLGLVSRSTNRISEAKVLYEKAIEVSRWSGDLEYLAQSYGNLGFLSFTYYNPYDAILYYDLALQINDKFPFALVQNYLGLCNAHWRIAAEDSSRAVQLVHFGLALNAAEQAMNWATKLGAKTNNIAQKIVVLQQMLEQLNRTE